MPTGLRGLRRRAVHGLEALLHVSLALATRVDRRQGPLCGVRRHDHRPRDDDVRQRKQAVGGEMPAPNVTSTAVMMCSFGMAPSTLSVIPTGVFVEGKPAATIMDMAPVVNIPPFGMCTSLANP